MQTQRVKEPNKATSPTDPMTSGSVKSVTLVRRARLLFGGVFASVLLVLAIFVGYPFVSRSIEMSAPQLKVPRLAGIGVATSEIEFGAVDPGAGLAALTIYLTQAGNRSVIYRKQLVDTHEITIKLEVSQFRQSLNEGEATFTLQAQDRSFWKNQNERSVTFKVDWQPPVLALEPTKLPTTGGISQLVLFQSQDTNFYRTGIELGGATYFGYPAVSVDRALSSGDLYLALIPGPRSGQAVGTLYSEDVVGNRSTREISFNTRPINSRGRRIELTSAFMFTTVRQLAQQKLGYLQEKVKIPVEEYNQAFLPKSEREEVLAKFSLLHTRLRALDNETLAKIPEGQRLGATLTDHFVRPNGEVVADFGDHISYVFEKQEIGSEDSNGLFIRTEQVGERVYSSNEGTVMFAGDNGVYGTSVIIDHGLGLSTRVTHLRASAVSVGQTVRRGDVIGYSGESGLAPFPMVYFEVRLHGTPVPPAEWCSAGEFYKRVTARLDEARTRRGIAATLPLDWSMK